MTKTISISIPDGLNIESLLDKVWQVLYAHDELISPEERVFVAGILEDLEGTSSDDVERNEEGDAFVVGCAKCGEDVYEVDDAGRCADCAH